MGYLRRTSHYLRRMMRYMETTSNYPERISNSTNMMSMADPITIDVETPRIYSECSLEKEFIKLIFMNLSIILYLTINQVYSNHGFVHGPMTQDTKNIL